MSSVPVSNQPATQPAETLEARFHRLADSWQRAVSLHSSCDLRENHPAYREIIALGPAAVPLLLRDLERNRRHWFAALEAITGANPIPPEDAGRIDRMCEDWLRWAKENHYRW